jgi:type II secretory pathway component PulK
MTRKPIDYIGENRRGSALLIVLGFLSFMMISAVAFAVYMRIERQASSNYRHAAGARHMLNSALYRAIEDVDLELRTNPDADFSRKFPLFPVRVRSAPGC